MSNPMIQRIRDILAEKGWSSNGPEGPNGEVCLAVAAARAFDGLGFYSSPEADAIYAEARRAGAFNIGSFNDSIAETVEDVFALLDRAEARLAA